MNRKERKKLEKELGIAKHLKTLTLNQRFERFRANQENGKKIQEEFIKNNEISQQADSDQKESDIINSLAENIAKTEKIPFIEALGKAQNERSRIVNK